MVKRMSIVVTVAAASVAPACVAPRGRAPAPATTIVRGEAGARLERYLSRAEAFGLSGAILVADTNGIVLRNGYGEAAPGVRVRPDMLFDMGSIVKQFTAAAILLLESEGKLATTDTLAKFFPQAPPDKAGITLHQLLTHTAGVTDNLSGDYADVNRDSAVRVVLNTRLLSPPGRTFNYSNAGFSTLAAIVELVSGQPYERFMQERLFGPSGMRTTGYHLPGLDTSRVAHTFTPPVDHGDPATRLARAPRVPSWNLMGNGGMLTTVDDIYAWELALRRGHPISHAIQRKQFAEQFRRTPSLAHGYDWWIEPAEDGGVQYNRGGDAPSLGLSAEYRRYSKDNSVFILLANNRHHGASTRRFLMSNMRRLFLGDAPLDPPATRPAPAAELAKVEGTYRVDSASYFVVRADPTRGRLSVSAIGQRAANVMIFNTDTTSIRGRALANDRMAATIRALSTQDSAAAAAALGSPERGVRLMAAWRDAEKVYGRFRCMDVLGTDRLDRGVFLTTARLTFADSVKVIRSTWNGTVPVVNSDDASLENNFGFAIDAPVEAAVWSPYWYLDGDILLTYDLLSNRALRARIARGADGKAAELVFETPGEAIRASRDTPRMQGACER
jgi:CubicO group peptidase (beta-lactamase class C family)